MDDLQPILDLLFREDPWGNNTLRWAIVVASVLVLFFVLKLLRSLLSHRVLRMFRRPKNEWPQAMEDLFRRTKCWFLLILAIYCGGQFLILPFEVREVITVVTVVALLVQAAIWADGILTFAIIQYARKNKEIDAASVTTLTALGFLGRMTIWTVAILLAMSNMGINVTTMIAGFGIGGVAVALAAQNILGDLFASASIVLDKPFVLGDFIVVDDKKGTIEHIGLKTTRLRSLSGEQLVFSNADLLKSRIHNYKRMNERRIVFSIGVSYDLPCDKVAAIPALLREIIESQRPVRFDRAHFASFGDSALLFEVVYYVLSTDYNVYMDVQQAVNLAIFRRFGEEKIDFAFPSQTVYLRQ